VPLPEGAVPLPDGFAGGVPWVVPEGGVPLGLLLSAPAVTVVAAVRQTITASMPAIYFLSFLDFIFLCLPCAVCLLHGA
jgi:hypothetical protein